MFETSTPSLASAAVASAASSAAGAEVAAGAPLTAAEIEGFVQRLRGVDRGASDPERVTQLGLLEAVKAAAAAAQAVLAVDFEASQVDAAARRGVPAAQCGRGVAEQVALARRDSAARGSRHLGLAKALVHEMPRTLEALRDGRTSEWRATILCRETAALSLEHRREVDARLGSLLGSMGDREVERAARTLAYQLDQEWPINRARGARTDRRVTIRPAPDTMTYLTGFLPMEQGVAAYAALDARAKTLIAAGDPRTRGQIMADTLVERLTGQTTAAAVPLEVHLVMTDAAMLGDADTPAQLPGHGPLPAGLARELIAGLTPGADPGAGADTAAVAAGGDAIDATRAQVWLRRLFTDPDGTNLVAMDSRRRCFDGLLRRLITLRDQNCRTPWCGAPIRHADHVEAVHDGGATTSVNAQGLCARCNYAKEAAGWRTEPPAAADVDANERPAGGAHAVRITTPTGHTYHSTAPPILGHGAIRRDCALRPSAHTATPQPARVATPAPASPTLAHTTSPPGAAAAAPAPTPPAAAAAAPAPTPASPPMSALEGRLEALLRAA